MKPADNFDLKKFITEGKLLKEEIEGNKLFLYHRTKTKNTKSIIQNNFKLIPGFGRAGEGIYFVYDKPIEIKSGMDVYGGVSLKYSIPVSSLDKFLVFDSDLQTKSLEQQLSPIKDKINDILNQEVLSITKRKTNPSSYISPLSQLLLKIPSTPQYEKNPLQGYIDLYNKNKLKQLSFIEMIEIIEPNLLKNNYDGILYSVKGDVSSGGFAITGTQKTAIIFNPSILTFEGISTDGINYKKVSNTDQDINASVKSPEYLLKRNQTPPNSTIKKSLVKLNGFKELQLPSGLKIIGSLDLRNIPNLVIPDDLHVTNTIYISPGTKIPDDVKSKAKNIVTN
jgi:hypothetical protein